jgi:hypothetical protein
MVYLIRTPLSSNISIEQVRTQLTFTDDTVNELIPLLDRVTITEMGGKELEREQKVMKVKNTPIHLYTNTPIHLYTYSCQKAWARGQDCPMAGMYHNNRRRLQYMCVCVV